MNKYIKPLYYVLILLIILLSIIIFRLIKLYDIVCTILNIVSPIIIGYIIAWLLNPIYNKLNKRLHKKLSFTIIVISTILFYIFLIRIILPVVLKESKNLFNVINTFIHSIKYNQNIIDFKKYRGIDANFILDYCNSILSNIINIGLGHMFGFYILYNYSNIKVYTRRYIPTKYKSDILKFTRRLSKNMYLYIKGTIIDTVILFICSTILFMILKLKYAILLAFVLSITNIIPFIGPYIGGLPAIIVGMSNNFKYGIFVLIVIVLIQIIESNIVNPLIMSKCIKINPLLIIITITIMGNLFGVVGIIFAVPIIITIKLIYESFMINKKEKN